MSNSPRSGVNSPATYDTVVVFSAPFSPGRPRNWTPASVHSPAAKLCVASLFAPSRYVPTNPPVLPIEFTSAIDAAAPTPPTCDVAIAQNGPNIAASAAIATVSVATVQIAVDDRGLAA